MSTDYRIVENKKYKHQNFIKINSLKELYKNKFQSISGFYKQKKRIILYRDAIGLSKLFFFIKKKQIHISSNYLHLSKKKPNTEILTCPPGHIYIFEDKKIYLKKYDKIQAYNFTKKNYLKEANKILDRVFKYIKIKFKKYKIVLCLSSGHDSNLVLTQLINNKIKDFQITSFAFVENDKKNDYEKNFHKKLNHLPADFVHAFNVANENNINFLPVFVTLQDIKKNLKKIIFLNQDYRNYNVHCAIVNFFIGKEMKKNFRSKKVMILTGDLMNEFFADYDEVKYKNKVIYKIPKIKSKKKQIAFTNSLESSSREIGIFSYFNFKLYQPFSHLRDLIFSIKEKDLSKKNLRQDLNGNLINKDIRIILPKHKVRAQIGDNTTPNLVDALEKINFDEKYFKKIWASLFDKKFNEDRKKNVFYLGKYNSNF